MKTIESALESTDGYIPIFSRNTIEGWWELEMGLPKTWVFEENSEIGCEVTFDHESGKVVRIFPKKDGIVIDDLVAFVELIIVTNEKISEKEKEFTDKLKEMKNVMESEAKKYYDELDEMKENVFKTTDSEKPKRGRPRKKLSTIAEDIVNITPISTEETTGSIDTPIVTSDDE